MRAKAEGVVEGLFRLLPRFRRNELPNPNLSFNKRCELAVSLSTAGQVAFISREISTLLPFTRTGGVLSFPKQLVEQSSLPAKVKMYVLGAPLFINIVDPAIRDKELLLLLTSDRNGFSIELRRDLLTRTGHLLELGLTVGGEKRGSKGNISADPYIRPAYHFQMPDAAIRQTGAYNLYQDLHAFIENAGGFAMARELVRFAHQVISARAQPPAPTPPAAAA